MNAKQKAAAMKLAKGPLSSQRLVDLLADDGPLGQWIMGVHNRKSKEGKENETEMLEEIVKIFNLK